MCIEKVNFLKNYIIEIVLSGNYTYLYDLKSQFHSSRFHCLNDEKEYENGHVEDGCRIVWNTKCHLEDYEIFGRDFVELLM